MSGVNKINKTIGKIDNLIGDLNSGIEQTNSEIVDIKKQKESISEFVKKIVEKLKAWLTMYCANKTIEIETREFNVIKAERLKANLEKLYE